MHLHPVEPNPRHNIADDLTWTEVEKSRKRRSNQVLLPPSDSSPNRQRRHNTAEDLTNIEVDLLETSRKRQSNEHLTPLSPKRPRTAASPASSAKSPERARFDVSLRNLDIEAELLKHPEFMREKLRELFNYRLVNRRNNPNIWFDKAEEVSKSVPRHHRIAFVTAAQELCMTDDWMLPPTVLFTNRFPQLPTRGQSGTDDSRETHEEFSHDWEASYNKSPAVVAKQPRNEAPMDTTQTTDGRGPIVTDLDQSELSFLRVQAPEYPLGCSFFNATTVGGSSSSEPSYDDSSASSAAGRAVGNRTFTVSGPSSPLVNRTFSVDRTFTVPPAVPSPENMNERLLGPERATSPVPSPAPSPASSPRAYHSGSSPDGSPTASRSPTPRRSPLPRSVPIATARSPSPPPADIILEDHEKRIGDALEHIAAVPLVSADLLDKILALKRGRSSCRTLMKKAAKGEDVATKTAALMRRMEVTVRFVGGY